MLVTPTNMIIPNGNLVTQSGNLATHSSKLETKSGKPGTRRHSTNSGSTLHLNTTIGGLSPVIEEQLMRQRSETFEVVDGDNTKFTFSIISDISSPGVGQGCLEGTTSVKPAIKKTCKTIAQYIR